ncbi:MAG: methyltransferase domain-containing protein [Calditrichaeota bacterium]|nr:methyltransferase domain-containing protein [Calditrichota bacterium]
MNASFPEMPDIALRFDALFQWLSRMYQLELTELKIEGFRLNMYRVANINQVLDEVAEQVIPAEDDIPYWAEIWPSAIALSRFIARELHFRGQQVVELGCGTGLVGVMAGLKGGDVVFTDLKEDALRLAELNWMMNLQTPARSYRLDWRIPDADRVFDIILASDVAYEERHFHPLVETFQQLLAPDGVIYLSEPNRAIARRFFQLVEAAGFVYQRFEETVNLSRKPLTISIYKIRRKQT